VQEDAGGWEEMISPTGKGIRETDDWGSGRFGAPRGNGNLHNGVDFICTPGQSVFSPISGVVVREAKPYPNSDYSGVLLHNDNIDMVLFYLIPDANLIGGWCVKGAVIGVAQDISEKYPDMIPHVHLKVVKFNPELLLDMP